MKYYLFRWVIICVDDYFSLFDIIDVFGIKGVFVVICNHLFM